ncbi:HpcH/HpaI aldolase/citrate lyase family protein [Variovorax sp. GB1P17]|uniref:HpcH/HpaI aldolase/citrate lyase family protein n=1 Tax=Variovorax sp. GB1P17 TaxID=3443740 RepID=UPI003F4551EE
MPLSQPASLSAVRCLLFVPGHRPDRYPKAVASGADAICIDLEDAVAPALKDEARNSALEFIANRSATSPFVYLRINGLRTAAGLRDLLTLATCSRLPDAVLLPKTQGVDEIRLANEVVNEVRAGRSASWIPLFESAIGMAQAGAIAQAAPGVGALMFGGADYSADVGASFEWEPLLLARQQLVQAAATSQCPAIDVPYLDINDSDGLSRESRRAAALGFSCKAAIHPAQVSVIQAAFTPTAEQVERASRIVQAAAKSDGGALSLDGTMIDAPVIALAHRLLLRARQAAA